MAVSKTTRWSGRIKAARARAVSRRATVGTGVGAGGRAAPKAGEVLVPVGKTKEGKTVWGKAPPTTKFYPRVAGGYRVGGVTYSTVAKAAAAEAKAAEVKVVEVKVEPGKKYYYDPVTRVATTKAVEGQEAMTKAEVLTVIRRMPREAKVEYAEAYRGYLESKKPITRVEPRVEPTAEVPPMAEIMRERAPPPRVKPVEEIKVTKKPSWVVTELKEDIDIQRISHLKGIKDWRKDVEKIERMFEKARTGYVWAGEKVREYKLPKPPKILVEKAKIFEYPYKAVAIGREQLYGITQIGKVTMGAMVGITEEVKVKPYKLPLIYAAGAVVGPAAAKILGVGKVAKVAAVGLGAAWTAGISAEVMARPPGIEREKAVGVRAAELAAFIGGAKYGIERKPVTRLYKAVVEKPYIKYVKEPRFERAIAEWQKGITAKDWTYLEKRAFIPIKKMPQRTLLGRPIRPIEIRLARKAAGLDKVDVIRHELPKELVGYEKLIQKPLRDIYVRKAIDLAYPKVITVTPKKMITMKYRQMFGAEPGRFIFEKPKLKIIPDITKIDKSIQTMLAPKVRRVTKIDRPFYITKPKLPKPVILGKPKKITPVHLKPEPRVKVKPMEVMPGVSVRPVYAAEPRPVDVGEIIGTIPKGRALAGALVLGGLRLGAEDLTGVLSRQFGAARRREEQRQAARLAALLAQQARQAAKQRARQAAKQIPKVKPVVKVVPKLEPVVKVVPKLKIPTKQIPKLKQPVPTIPVFPYYPTYPVPEEPIRPIIPLPIIPKFKWPRGRILLAPRKRKKIKPFHKYMPSLIAGMEKITAYKVPKRITGLGIRPVVIKRF